MKIPTFCKISFIALVLSHTSYFLAPQKAQAHHNPVHSVEQAATKAAVSTAVTGEKVAVKAASDTSAAVPLAATGGVVLLGLTGMGLYTVRKKQSA
jgi:hypothetical protein